MKYVIYLNGIVWDTVVAKNKKDGKGKAKRKVEREFKKNSLVPECMRYDKPFRIELESIKSFLGK